MRWRIRITDQETGVHVLDVLVSRLVAAAVATAVGLQDAANKIIGDPRSDQRKESPSSKNRNMTPDR